MPALVALLMNSAGYWEVILSFLLPSGTTTSKLPQTDVFHSSVKDYVISLTIKKFILISNVDKHQVKHISTPAIFRRGIKLFAYLLLRDLYKEKVAVC